MSSTTEYCYNGWRFEPEDVMPYYDLYEDGTMMLYIRTERRFPFSLIRKYDIVKVHEGNIKWTTREVPVRMNCLTKRKSR